MKIKIQGRAGVSINSNLAIVYCGQFHLGNEVVVPVHNVNTQTR